MNSEAIPTAWQDSTTEQRIKCGNVLIISCRVSFVDCFIRGYMIVVGILSLDGGTNLQMRADTSRLRLTLSKTALIGHIGAMSDANPFKQGAPIRGKCMAWIYSCCNSHGGEQACQTRNRWVGSQVSRDLDWGLLGHCV